MNAADKTRIQRKAADPEKSVHLSASAGSGKTKSLVDRYLALLGSGRAEPDQSVAITFTEKAAAEMKQRVMSALAEADRQSPASGSGAEAMFKKIIRGRQDLRISTIHSFCMNLLKRYPLEAGIPPDFGVLDSRDQAYKIQMAAEDALEELDRDPAIMGPLRDFTADDLFDLIGFLLSMRCRLKRIEIDAGGPEGLFRAVILGMGTVAEETEIKALIGNPEWKAVFLQMELFLRSQGGCYEKYRGSEHASLAEANDTQTAYRLAELLMPVYFTQKDEYRKKLPIARTKYVVNKMFRYDAYETLYAQVQAALSRFLSSYRRIQAGHKAISLLRLYLRAEEKYRDAKLREGLLDFDDLEIYAYRLLKGAESPEILYWLDRKIIHFLVDEFQDTSDIQWAILEKLTEEIFSGQGADKPMSPTLFVVGDEKQSIYRFREANYQLINSVRKKMAERLPETFREVLTLSANFRSVPEIVHTVNQVFAKLWGADYTPSEPDRHGHAGSVRLIESVPDSAGENPSGLLPEAEVLAREIKSLVENGTRVYEKEGTAWKERPAGYGDCAVLIQSRTRLKEYEAALQRENIPYRVVGGIGFYEEDEIQAVMNVLFFLWNRRDRLALAAALKSPFFGFTDRDIFDLVRDSGDMLDALRQRNSDAGKLLDDWSRRAGVEPLAGLVHRIIADTGAYVRFGRLNPQAIFNLDKLLDTAREFDRRGYTTLQDFVEWVRNIRRTEEREATADVNLPEFQGSVVITTVHKAKGLEFTAVFLPGMNQFPKSLTTGPEAIIQTADVPVRLSIKNADNPAYREMWEREKEEIKREHQRLLYVAMTRARDHLIMIGASPVKQNTWLDFLHETSPLPLFETAAEIAPNVILYSYPVTRTNMPAGENPPSPPPGGFESEQKIDGYTLIKNLSPVTPAGPAESLEWKRATDFIDQRREEEASVPLTGAVSPLTRGTILHRCLENLTMDGAYDLEQVIREFPERETLGKDEKEKFMKDIETVLRSLIDSRELTWVFERRRDAYSELPFLYKRGRNLISGVIDRVIVKEAKGFVIDYKAIFIENDDALASWKDHYRSQIRIYCEAVKEIFKLDQVEGYLLFLDSGRLEKIGS